MSGDSPSTFRVATWNIHSAVGLDGRRSIERIAEQIEALSADVVCLQEVWSNRLPLRRNGMIQFLAKKLHMYHAFAPTYERAASSYGVGMLSTRPIIATSVVDLPNPEERARRRVFREKRVALVCDIEFGGSVVHVFSTHWSLEAADRLGAANIIATCIQESNGFMIVGGDLNVDASATEVQELLNRASLSDAGASANNPTFPSEQPQHRIDYILCGSAIRCMKAKTVYCDGSDHLPVVADLRLNVS